MVPAVLMAVGAGFAAYASMSRHAHEPVLYSIVPMCLAVLCYAVALKWEKYK